MRLFWHLTKRALQRQLTYRAATLAGLATNFFFGILRASVMAALYGGRVQVEGMTLRDAVTYTGLTQSMIAFLSLFSWYEVMNSVSTGEIASDLLKPMSYYRFWLAQDLGRAIMQLVLRGLPIMAVYALFFRISTPDTMQQWSLFLAALIFSWWVSFSWRFLVNLAAFWSPDAIGIGRLAFTISWFTSGFLMPLRFFPEWFQRLCYLTPFPHMINTPVEIYLGVRDTTQALLAILSQMGWILALWMSAQIVLRAGVRRLVIQGG